MQSSTLRHWSRSFNAGWVGGAALDKFDTEPLPAGHPLLAS
jgi:phosphoglycerate dehydrogenase-like enzyme